MKPIPCIVHPIPRNPDLLFTSWNSATARPILHAVVNEPPVETMSYTTNAREEDDDEFDDRFIDAFSRFQHSSVGCQSCPYSTNHELTANPEDIETFLQDQALDAESMAESSVVIKIESPCDYPDAVRMYADSYCHRHECCLENQEYISEIMQETDPSQEESTEDIPAPPLRICAEICRDGTSTDHKLAIQRAFWINKSIPFLTSPERGVNMFGGYSIGYPVCWGQDKDNLVSLLNAYLQYLTSPSNDDLATDQGHLDSIENALQQFEESEGQPLLDAEHIVHGIRDFRFDPHATPVTHVLIATAVDHPAAFARLVGCGIVPRPADGDNAYVALALAQHTVTAADGRQALGLRTAVLPNDTCWFVAESPSVNQFIGSLIGQLDAANDFSPIG